MSARPIDHQAPEPHDGVSERTRLLRAAADGELDAVDAALLKRHLEQQPEDCAVIDAERRLRSELADLAKEPVPASVSARLAARVAASARSDDRHEVRSEVVGRVDPSKGVLRMLALAALVAIVAIGGTILTTHLLSPAPAVEREGYRTELIRFIDQHQHTCEVHAELVGTYLTTTAMDKVPHALAGILGGSPDLGELEAQGFVLLGAGRCAVPGRGRSARLVFRAPPEAGQAVGSILSLHIQEDRDEDRRSFVIPEGTTLQLVDERNDAERPSRPIYCWRHDGFVFFVTAQSESAVAGVVRALGAPLPSGAS
jgi:anti-sigma factor RsiW